MADRQGKSGAGRWITIIVVVLIAIGAWWVFDAWNQPPATYPATGEAPVQNPSEGPPMTKGDSPQLPGAQTNQ